MPELPEVEAWRRSSTRSSQRSPVEQAGPAHIATLKTFDPPLHALEGRALRVERRAKRFLLPTDDDELVLLVHLMSAGRLKYVPPGGKGREDAGVPAALRRRRRAAAHGGGLEEARRRLAAPPRDALARELAHLGPEANELSTDDVARILASDSRRLHSLLRDQRLIAGIGRAWANEILWSAQLSPYALSSQVDDDGDRAARRGDLRRAGARLELRLAGANDDKTYRVHDKLGRPCERCGTPIARVDFEEHTIYYCPSCQTGGRVLKDRGCRGCSR